MATTVARRNQLFARHRVLVLAALFPVGFLTAAERSDERRHAEPDRTLPVAPQETESASALDGQDFPKLEQSRFRTWTDASGEYRTEAAFLGFENGEVRLEKRDGARITIPIDRLAEADQEFVKTQMAPRPNEEEAPVEASQAEGDAKATSPGSYQARLSPKDTEARRTTAAEEPATEADQNEVDSGVPQDVMATAPGVQPGSTPSASQEDEQPEPPVEGLLADSPQAAPPSAPQADVLLRGQRQRTSAWDTPIGILAVMPWWAWLTAVLVPAVVLVLVVGTWRRRLRGGPRPIHEKKGVTYWIGRLRSRRANIRIEAASALGDIGPAAASAVPALSNALEDEEWIVRSAAAMSLGGIGPPAKSAVSALTNALEDEDEDVREEAASALGKIGPAAAAAVPALTNALRDEDEEVREEAASALGKIDPAAAYGVLRAK